MNILKLKPYVSVKNKDYTTDTKIIIEKASFQNTTFRLGASEFFFSDCQFGSLEIENEEEIDFQDINIHFSNCYIKKLRLNSFLTPNFSLFFGNCILDVTISNKNIKSVIINNCLVHGSVFLTNVKNASILYTEQNVFPIKWRRLFKSINTDFQSIVREKQNFIIGSVENLTFSLNEQSDKKKGLFKKPYAQSREIKYGYYLSEVEKRMLLINLNIQYEADVWHKSTKVINAKLSSLSLQGYSRGKIEIENCEIDNIKISSLSCEMNSSLYNVKPYRAVESNNNFEIKNSNLDKIWFDNISFDDYSIISFYRNKFGDTSITSCNFPEDYKGFDKLVTVENIHRPDKKDDNYYKLRYETLLQIKRKLEDQGNFYEAQKFSSVTKEALRKVDNLSWWDKQILYLSSVSNKHGLSIKEPFIATLVSALIFYILYLLSLGRIFNNNDIDYNLIGYYFKFLDITHRSDFLVSKEELNGWSLTIDYVGKIFISFFIYQFIAAFRKYGKS